MGKNKNTISTKDAKIRKQLTDIRKRKYVEQKQKDKGKEAVKQKLQKKKDLKAKQFAEAEAERKRVQEEKAQRIKISKKKRLEKTKAISKRTQRGQPLMKDRMQLLLKQIQEMKKS